MQETRRCPWEAWKLAALGVVIVGTWGCAQEAAPDDLEDIKGDELLNGAPTLDRPEIGRISGCTATLIAPNVAITAAHCLDYQSREEAGHYGFFTVDRAGTSSRSFQIERYKSFDDDLGRRDVALLRLADEVPPSVATPTDIATRDASNGETVTVFGYGCTDRRTQRGGFTKRKHSYAFGRSANLCPGDSGGPVVLGTTGPVFLINSGYYTRSGTDIFGEPHGFVNTLREQIRVWDARYGGPETPNQTPDLEPDPPDTQTCLGALSREQASDLADGAQGRVCAGRDTWLGFELAAGRSATLTVSFDHSAGDIDMELYDPNGIRKARSTSTNNRETFTVVAEMGGRHALRVYGYQGDANTITISAQSEGLPIAPPDTGCREEPDEPNDSLGDAGTLTEGTYPGQICGDDGDWYAIETEGAWTLRITFDHATGDLDLQATTPSGAQTAVSQSIENVETVSGQGPGFVRVYGYDGAVGAYEITLE